MVTVLHRSEGLKRELLAIGRDHYADTYGNVWRQKSGLQADWWKLSTDLDAVKPDEAESGKYYVLAAAAWLTMVFYNS